MMISNFLQGDKEYIKRENKGSITSGVVQSLDGLGSRHTASFFFLFFFLLLHYLLHGRIIARWLPIGRNRASPSY